MYATQPGLASWLTHLIALLTHVVAYTSLAPQVTPSKFKGFNSSATSIKLRWEPIPPGQVAGVLRQFYITYRQLNTTDNTLRTIAVPITNLSFELTSLRKYTTYRLEIKAATKFPGMPTAPIDITTDEDSESICFS